METIFHALWLCPALRPLRKHTGWYHLFPKQHLEPWDFLQQIHETQPNICFERFVTLSWLVWFRRNKKCFQHSVAPITQWMLWAIEQVDYHQVHIPTTAAATSSSSGKALFWSKVDDETLLLNCDAAIDLASQRMGRF
uniref:Uncharacterized protein n=1 Tax=Cannabis sativa TaxID=3483 RepID=A0A803QHM2_CANSA